MQTVEQLEIPACQRWWEQESSFIRDDEPFRWSQGWEVSPLDRATARTFIQRHHYLKKLPVNRERFGLYNRRGYLVGVAVYGVPSNYAAFSVLGCDNDAALELSRLVLLDGAHGALSVPCNGESAFVGRCHDLLRRKGYEGVISFSDPMKRTATDGREITPGHVGGVYQGCSAVYLGQSRPGPLLLLPDGQALHRRTVQKIRHLERNWEAAVTELRSYGAGPFVGEAEAWLDEWVPKLTRRLHHPGNHKYAFALHRAVRRALPPSKPYPVPPGGRVAPKWGVRAQRLAA